MVIGIDIRALAGQRAGKGWSVYHILKNLVRLPEAGRHRFVLYAREQPRLDFALPGNFCVRIKKLPSLLWHWAVANELNFSDEVDVYFSPVSFIVPALVSHKCVLLVNDLVARLFPAAHNRKATLIENLTLKPALKKSRAIIAISESTKRDLEKYYPDTRGKITVAPLAAEPLRQKADSEERQRVRDKYKLPDKFLLFVGTLEPRKNIVRLVEAYARVKDQTSADLVLAGQKGWQWEEIFATIKRLKLGSRVHFLDYVGGRDLPILYQLAALLALPSLYEGFGLPVLEAMQAGCPVLTSDVSALPEVAGGAAVLADPQSIPAIADGITEALRRKDELVAKGYEQTKKFSWGQTAERILAVLTKNEKVPTNNMTDQTPRRKLSRWWALIVVIAVLAGAALSAYFTWLAIPIIIAVVLFVAALVLILDKPWIGVLLTAFFLPFERIGGFDLVGQNTIKINQLFAAATIVAWLLCYLIITRKASTRTPIIWPILGYLAVATGSLLNAQNFDRGVMVWLFTFFAMIFALVIPQVVTTAPQTRKIILALLISAGLVALFGLYQFAGDVVGLPPTLTGLREQYTNSVFGFPRVHSTALEPLYLANYLLIPIALGFMIWVTARPDKSQQPQLREIQISHRTILLGILVVSVLALILTLSRGGFLGLAATGATLIVLSWRRLFKWKNFIPIILIIAAAALGVIGFLNFSGNFSPDKFWQQATEYKTGTSVDERYDAYGEAEKLWDENIYFGVGIGNFGPRVAPSAYVMPKEGWAIVNNETLEILAETGILGLAAIAGLFLLVIWRAIAGLVRARRIADEKTRVYLMAVSGGLLAALIGILVQYQTFSTLYILHVWFVVGMMEAVRAVIDRETAKASK